MLPLSCLGAAADGLAGTAVPGLSDSTGTAVPGLSDSTGTEVPGLSDSTGTPAGSAAADSSWLDPEALLDALLGGASAGSEEDEEEVFEEMLRLLREAAALRANPVDVNRASLASLLRVPSMDVGTALLILAVRRERGPVKSVDELSRAGIDKATLDRVRPYLVALPDRRARGVRTRSGGSRSREEGGPPRGEPWLSYSVEVRSASSLGPSSGREARWPGPGVDAFARLKASVGERLSVGAGLERDAGEPRLVDHGSFHITWTSGARRSERPGLRVIVGDLRVRWGQGLVARGGGFGGAASYPFLTDRASGYGGACEYGVRRGLIAELERGGARALVLVARTRFDATLDDDGLVTALRSTGYHRTDGEIAAADALEEDAIGARVVFTVRRGVEVGATAVRLSYDPAFAAPDPVRAHFRFAGSLLDVLGADVRVTGSAWRFGGEVARTSKGGRAFLGAAVFAAGRARVRAGAAYVSPAYDTPLGGAVPGASSGRNGRAGWFAAKLGIGRNVGVRASALLRTQPWRGHAFELPRPSLKGSVGLDVRLPLLGSFTIDLKERRSVVETGEPSATAERIERSSVATFTPRDEPRVVLLARARTASVCGVETGRTFAAGARVTADLGNSFELSAGAIGVSKNGDVRAVVVAEPRLAGEFGLHSLNESGTRWYIRVRGGLAAGIGAALRLNGGPGSGDLEIGLGFDIAGSAVRPRALSGFDS